MLDNDQYNDWRRDISCEYVLRTGGRAFPKDREKLISRLVQLSDLDVTPSPIEAVDILINEKLLQP